MLSLSNLHKYQLKSRDFILDNNNCGLFQQCGLGKTVSTLTAISDLLEQREVRKILVVSTLRVANTVWHTEVKEWEHLQHLTVSRIIGNAVQRKEAINGAVIHTINIENLPWLVREACRTNFPYDFVVFDESSLLKNPSSQRFKAAKAMLSALSRVVILTGSPAANGVHDLWSQIYLLDRGQRLGKNITQFRNKWFRQNRFYGYDPLPNALIEIPARIEDICLSMKANDYLDVPEMIENEIEIELSASAKKVYKDMRKQLLVEINNTDIESPTAATLVNKCQQISNGFLYDEQKNIHVLHENKLDALESIIEETESPILIFYTFKADLEVIKKRFSYVQTLENDSDLVVRLWNQGDVPILCCHPRSAGHGLNLQKGGNTIVWYGLTFSWELFEQANSRLHRQGQRKNVFVHYLLGLGTIDHLVLKALRNKERVQDSVFEQLKALDKS
jgi:SNF2 family DNA or RNA helicase